MREGNAPPIDISGNYFRGVPEAGRRLALTDRGLSLLARRDHTSVGVAKRRWSIALEYPEGPFEWRNVTGRRGRQLLRNVEHTAAVHGFLAALSTQAPLRALVSLIPGQISICRSACLAHSYLPASFVPRYWPGPLTVSSSPPDSFLSSSVQMAPWAEQSVVAFRSMATSALEPGVIVISQRTFLPGSSRRT